MCYRHRLRSLVSELISHLGQETTFLFIDPVIYEQLSYRPKMPHWIVYCCEIAMIVSYFIAYLRLSLLSIKNTRNVSKKNLKWSQLRRKKGKQSSHSWATLYSMICVYQYFIGHQETCEFIHKNSDIVLSFKSHDWRNSAHYLITHYYNVIK